MHICVKPPQCLSFLLLLTTVKALHPNPGTRFYPGRINANQDEVASLEVIGDQPDAMFYPDYTIQDESESLSVEDYDVPGQPDHYSLSETTTKKSNAKVVTIAVLGRRGSGISSTIRELIGPHTKCIKPESKIFKPQIFPNIVEYTVEVPFTNGSLHQLKFLDVPGFIDGRTLKQEARILASLKYYVQIASNPPDFYLGLSKFDDSRIDGIYSLFVQFLKRVELFHDVFLNNTITDTERKIIFLLTHMMSETRANQRKPDEKIKQFRRIIQEYTGFPTPISIVVGDNNAVTDYGVRVENGYYRLPNKQLYPKNVWEALINSSSNSAAKDILTTVMDSRESQLQCEAKLISPAQWEHVEDDADAFYYLFTLANTTVEETEINRKVEKVFVEKNGKVTQMEEIVQKVAMQLRLQQENITSVENLPKAVTERAVFFQNNQQFSATIPALLLNDAFNLTMPKYEHELTVGYGYMVMSDEMVARSPFTMDTFQPSSIGYQIPNFMKCRKLVPPEIQYFKGYSANMSDYIKKRLKYLDFRGKDNTTVDGFTVEVKEGFNLQPKEGEDIISLTAVEELRTLTCRLASNRSLLGLNPEFILEVDSLMRFDKHDRDSVNNWKCWFNKWGSHIVVHSYGGGTLYGSIEGSEVRNALKSQASIEETLNALVKFTPFPVDNLGVPSYTLDRGKSDENSTRLYNLSETARKELIDKWKESLNADFIMLTNQFRLQPISELITERIGNEKGQIVDEAIDLLLRGELKYSRRRKGPTKRNGSNRNQQTQANRNSDQVSGVETVVVQRQPTTPFPTPTSDEEERHARIRRTRTSKRKTKGDGGGKVEKSQTEATGLSNSLGKFTAAGSSRIGFFCSDKLKKLKGAMKKKSDNID